MTISTTGRNGKKDIRGNRGGRSAGFTLLEMILVMVVITIVLSMAAPSLNGFARSRPIFDISAQLVTLADYARSQAVAEGRVYRLNLDTESGRFWLTVQAGGAFESLGQEIGRVFRLPEETRAEWIEPPARTAGPNLPGFSLTGGAGSPDQKESAGNDYIEFYPDGSVEPAVLRLTDRRNNRLDIVCPSPMDRFQVISSTGT